MSQVNGDSDAELSSTARGFLIATGVSAVAIALCFGYIFYKCVSAVLGLFKSSQLDDGAKSKSKSKQAAKLPEATARHIDAGKDRGPDLKSLIKDSQKASVKKGPSKDEHASHHHLFLNTLKGHADTVHSVAWSADGLSIATACEDMYVRLFDMADVTNRDPKFKRIKTAKIPVGAGFGDRPDEVAVGMKGIPDTLLAVYSGSANKSNEGPAFEQQWLVGQVHGKEPVLAVRCAQGSAAAGRRGVIVSLSTKKDVRVYSLQGRELAMIEPNSLTNHELAVSLDGRFVAVASFTAEIKIWELKWAKESGDFRGAPKVMELKGHKSQVLTVAFSPDNKRAVTASKDGTLRVWNIDVRYHLSEDPKTTLVIPMPLAEGKCYQHLAFGPNNVIAGSLEGNVHLLSATTGDLLDNIDAHDSTITSMQWCPVLVKTPAGPSTAVLATSSRDKRVRLWSSP